MDYKYEETLERCKKEFNFNNLAYSHEEIKQRLERVFPELKESEEELMRKETISIIRQYSIICEREGDKCYTVDKVIAWLEKQGEQKPICNEDERIRKALISRFNESGELDGISYDDIRTWLEKQNRSFLLKNEKHTLARIIEYLEDNGCPSKWKELLCDVYTLPYQKEQKPTWSEEDERLLKLSLENLAELKNRFGEKYGRAGECICWLKSIKERMKGE